VCRLSSGAYYFCGTESAEYGVGGYMSSKRILMSSKRISMIEIFVIRVAALLFLLIVLLKVLKIELLSLLLG
jgi:hypothetical protein